MRFAQSRAQGGESGRRELLSLLHPQVQYEVLGRVSHGAQAVAEILLTGNNGPLASRLDWQEPLVIGERVRLTGIRGPGSTDRGLVVTLSFDGQNVTLVQEQRTPPPPPPIRPIVLTAELKRRIDHALEERHPMLVSHVDPQGQPVLTFRGSVQAFSDDQLAMWIRSAEGGFIESIRANPRIALMYRDEEAKATYQFQGRAQVTTDQQQRQMIFDKSPTVERAHDFAMLGVAVVVDLDRVEGYSGLGPMGQLDGVRMLRATPN